MTWSRLPPNSVMTESLPIILLSGMGADERVFARQAEVFPELQVPAWIPPEANETLAAYAERLAREVEPVGPCILGGASFGGMVAVEMAPHLDVRALVLIGSVRSPEEFPPRIRRARWAGKATRWVPYRLVQVLVKAGMFVAGRRTSPSFRAFLQQFVSADKTFLRWATRALLRWEQAPSLSCPIYQIHGGKDGILPAKLTYPDEVIPGGGHVISLSHADQVNQFLASVARASSV